jgi:hypothetical protein
VLAAGLPGWAAGVPGCRRQQDQRAADANSDRIQSACETPCAIASWTAASTFAGTVPRAGAPAGRRDVGQARAQRRRDGDW